MAFRAKTVSTATDLFVLQDIETESNNQVIDGILYPHLFSNSIAGLALPVNESIYTWINNYIAQYGMSSINIVIQDWYAHKNGLVSAAIAYDSQPIMTIQKGISKEKMALLKQWLIQTTKSINKASSTPP